VTLTARSAPTLSPEDHMRRFLLGLLGALALAGLVLPPLAAVVAKARLAGTQEDDETADEINLVAIFEGVDVTSRAAAFRGGSVLAWYGGGDLDLRGATLDPAGARLRARSIFGGLRILVPASWRVEVRSVGLFGGVGNNTDPAIADPASPTLTIDALSAFGGLAIVNEPDEDEFTFKPMVSSESIAEAEAASAGA
jgi:hypothetical protein